MFCIYCYICPPPYGIKTQHVLNIPNSLISKTTPSLGIWKGSPMKTTSVKMQCQGMGPPLLIATSTIWPRHATLRLELPLVRSEMIIGSSSCLIVESARFFVNIKALCECLHSTSSLFACPLYHAFCKSMYNLPGPSRIIKYVSRK